MWQVTVIFLSTVLESCHTPLSTLKQLPACSANSHPPASNWLPRSKWWNRSNSFSCQREEKKKIEKSPQLPGRHLTVQLLQRDNLVQNDVPPCPYLAGAFCSGFSLCKLEKDDKVLNDELLWATLLNYTVHPGIGTWVFYGKWYDGLKNSLICH